MYLVVWTDEAFEQMARIIRENRARKDEIASALQEMAVRLRLDANTTGESRGGIFRVEAVDVVRVRARFLA